MKYKVGDIVKLRDDLEVDKFYKGIKFIYEMERLKHLPIELLKHEIFDNCYKVEDYNGKDYIVSEAMIERLWEECKSSEQVSKSEGKLRLIDILNKIANGELKEGTKVKFEEKEYMYAEVKGIFDLYCCYENCESYEYMHDTIFDDFHIDILNEEVELIEPNDFGKADKMAEHNHFADDGKMAECEHKWQLTQIKGGNLNALYYRCEKCGKTLEPTDNTKIEELDKEEMLCLTLQCAIAVLTDKLNEVIRKINKEEEIC